MSDSIITNEGNAKKVLLTVIEKIKDFDSTIQSVNPDYKDKAKLKSKDLVLWLYLAAVNHTSIISVQAAPVNNRIIKRAFEVVIKQCLSVTDNSVQQKVPMVSTTSTSSTISSKMSDISQFIQKPL